MKIKRFEISGYRRILNTKIEFGDATFLIGENNVGKSAILKALELFHSGEGKIPIEDFFFDEKKGYRAEKVVFIAEYSGLSSDAEKWRGFKGRVLKRHDGSGEIERYILFKKEFDQNGKSSHYLMEYDRQKLDKYESCKKAEEFINAGLPEVEIEEVFGSGFDISTNITAKGYSSKLQELSSIWSFDTESQNWFEHPGGFVGNILKMLPRFLFIPAEDKKNEIDGKGGALQNVMNSLFEDVRDSSENFKSAQNYLNKLALELDPNDDTKEFGQMLNEINTIVGNVFPETGLHVDTELDDANKVLKPHFNIEMSSNIRTSPERQGTGSIRSAAFALLRYRSTYLEKKAKSERNLIIGFEEPEIYLHPNAANSMRDEIYNLATSSTSQIICTTHSPFMIDLSKDIEKTEYPKQVLNLLKIELDEEQEVEGTFSNPFNITEAYNKLLVDDKDKVKFVLKIDDYIARVFFVRKIIIIEGDTEDVVLRETIKRLPDDKRKIVESNYQIIKARGKATIISLVKYLKSMGFDPFVIHDKDELKGATKFNKPISEAVGDDSKILMLEYCMEDVLGYEPPNNNKPYEAHKYINQNWEIDKGWQGIGAKWKGLIENRILPELFVGKVEKELMDN